jgi:hypothetical protein
MVLRASEGNVRKVGASPNGWRKTFVNTTLQTCLSVMFVHIPCYCGKNCHITARTSSDTPRHKCARVLPSSTSLRVETDGKVVVFCQYGTRALEIIFAHLGSIHPETQALVTNELSHLYCLIDCSMLLLVSLAVTSCVFTTDASKLCREFPPINLLSLSA